MRIGSAASASHCSRVAVYRAALEALEPRQLFSAVVSQPIANTVVNLGAATTTVDLSSSFADSEHTLVRMTTTQGNLDIELFDKLKPGSVANFLKYVNSGRYIDTFIHRSASLSSTDTTASPDIIQGGGYTYTNDAVGEVKTDAAIRNEFSDNQIIPNTRGTVAYAKTSDPNSATSGFFVNLTDNSTALDDTSNSGGFTVFGSLVNNTLATADAIAALPRFNFGNAYATLPLQNYTSTDYPTNPTADNLVLTTAASVINSLSYTVTSDNPALVAPTISGSNLSLAYGAGTGVANITVTATALDGTTISDTFAAGVGSLDVELGGTHPSAVSFTDADGSKVTASIAKGGSATLRLEGTDLTQSVTKKKATVAGAIDRITSITAIDTTLSTTLAVKASGGEDGQVEVRSLTTDAGLKSIAGKGMKLVGDATIGGTLGSLTLGAAQDGTITTGGTAADRIATAITLGSGSAVNLTSGTPIKSIKAGEFINPSSTLTTITAPSIGSIKTTATFSQDVTTPGAIGSITVGGAMVGHVTAASLGAVKAGSVADSTFQTTGNIKSVTVGGISDSSIFAGVTGAALPTAASALATQSSIGSVKAKTVAGTNIAAATLGNLVLGTITTANAAVPFGLAADTIGSLAGMVDSGAKFRFKTLTDQASFDAQATAQGVDFGDFVVRLFGAA